MPNANPKQLRKEKLKRANSMKNHLEMVGESEKSRNSLILSTATGKKMDAKILDWALNLTETNMSAMYKESAWGWDKADKGRELTANTARYLIVTHESTHNLVAFSHYRVCADNARTVAYCYELQVESNYQRMGIGKWLLSVLDSIALGCKLDYCMATVFKSNMPSLMLFHNLGYGNDCGTIMDGNEDYSILIKKIGS